MRKILFPLIALACLTACSDDITEGTNSELSTFDGNEIFMTINIKEVNSQSRAAETQDGGYQSGTELEYKVSSACFYFYDEQGVFVSRGEAWENGSAITGGNIEYQSGTIVVLRGLTSNKYPKYLVTVLNAPEDFESESSYGPAATLDEMQKKLSSSLGEGIQNTDNYFTMSSSSYNGGEEDERLSYFVTTVEEDNFRPEPMEDDDETNPVDVYVERLAAKVELGVNESLLPATIKDDSGEEHSVYLVQETISGMPNLEANSTENIYIEFLGWTLNATARYSNVVKDITDLDASSTGNGVGGWTKWNVPDDYRSYWGKSFNYGIESNYPQSAFGSDGTPNTDEKEESSSTWLNDYLKYTSLDESSVTLHSLGSDDPAYCAENTNTVDILETKNSSAITSALLKAVAWHVDDDVVTPITLIRYRGELFTESSFLDYVAQELLSTTYYYQEDGEYYPFDKEFLSISNVGNGSVTVVADEAAINKETWYVKAFGDEYEAVEADAVYAFVEEGCRKFYQDNLAQYGGTTINEFKDGLMYYSIPIEHLNTQTETDTDGNNILLEAQYGVVRNHWYKLNITSIANLGKGIVDPEEVIVPDPTESIYYYVATSVNILPWKVIEQNVTF